MDTHVPVKASRIRRLRDIDKLYKQTQEVYNEFEQHLRARRRLARKARKLANSVQKRYPDMQVQDEDLGLHEAVEELARSLYLARNSREPHPEDNMHEADQEFRNFFGFLRKLLRVPPWLAPEET